MGGNTTQSAEASQELDLLLLFPLSPRGAVLPGGGALSYQYDFQDSEKTHHIGDILWLKILCAFSRNANVSKHRIALNHIPPEYK